MSNNNLNTNSVTQTETSNQTQNSNLPKDYFELFTKHYKAIFAALVTAIPILGAALTFVFYLYDKSYLEYYNISEQWVNIELLKSVYNLIYKGCIALTMLLPNAIALSPLLFKKETRKKVKFEFFFTLSCAIIIFSIAFLIDKKTNFSYGESSLILWLLWILMFGMPVVLSLIINLINAIVLLCFHPIRTIKYLIHHIRNIKFKTLFQNIANGIDKMNNFSFVPPQNESDEERITNKNKALFILIIILFVIITFMVFYFSSLGTKKANGEKTFSIIKLNETEEYDNLEEDYNGDNPYIQSNKRIVNSKVVLSENDDYYLVINAYIDETDNDLKLYLFTREQMIIEKKDVAINLIELSDKDNKKVIP